MFKTDTRNTGLVRLSIFGAAVLVAFGTLHLVSCSSNSPKTTPNPPPPGTNGTNVVMYHNDIARTGQNLTETILTWSNVNSSSFGKLFVIAVDGKVDAQPLYLAQVNVGSQGMHNVLYVATEHGSVYGFDADSGTVLWHVSMLASGETPSNDRSCSQVTPEIGVTSTPVIDPKAGTNGTIYVVAMSKDGSGNFHQRLHALDVTTGAEQFGGPHEIQGSFPGTGDNSSGGNVIFDPAQYEERAGLLLMNRRGVRRLDVPLRCPPLYRLGHGLRSNDSRANQRVERYAER